VSLLRAFSKLENANCFVGDAGPGLYSGDCFSKASMSSHIEQILQLTDSSTVSSDDAIQQDIAKASQTSPQVRW